MTLKSLRFIGTDGRSAERFAKSVWIFDPIYWGEPHWSMRIKIQLSDETMVELLASARVRDGVVLVRDITFHWFRLPDRTVLEYRKIAPEVAHELALLESKLPEFFLSEVPKC